MKLSKRIAIATLPVALAVTPLYAAPADHKAKSERTPSSLVQLAQSEKPKATPKPATPKPSTGSTTMKKAPSKADQKAKAAAAAKKARNMARIKSAKPLTEVSASTERLTGAAVRNGAYQEVASVEDLQMKNGTIASVVITTGGFLGMGKDYYKVPADQVRVYSGEDAFFVVIDVTKDNVKQFVQVEKKKDRWVPAPKQTASEQPKKGEKSTKPAPAKPDTKSTKPDSKTMKKPEPEKKQDSETK